jgi:predicted exporter
MRWFKFEPMGHEADRLLVIWNWITRQVMRFFSIISISAIWYVGYISNVIEEVSGGLITAGMAIMLIDCLRNPQRRYIFVLMAIAVASGMTVAFFTYN